MANHTAVKAGGWSFRDPLTSTQMTGLQERLLKCPNFAEGSEHYLTGNLILQQGTGGAVHIYTPVTVGDGGVLSRFTNRGTPNSPVLQRTDAADFTLTRSAAGSFWLITTSVASVDCILPHSGYATGDELTIANVGANAFDVINNTGSAITSLDHGEIALFKLLPWGAGLNWGAIFKTNLLIISTGW